MKIFKMYHSATRNNRKVAQQIERVVKKVGHELETVEVPKNIELDTPPSDFVFAESEVYSWLPGKPLMQLFDEL